MTLRTIRDLLAAHPFFAGLTDEYLDLIAGCGQNVVFEDGTIVFREGDPANHFFVVREGLIRVELTVAERGSLAVATARAGDVLGWSWLFPPYEYSFDAVAMETTHAVSLDGACLRGKCDDDPSLGYELTRRFARLMAQRLEATRLQLLDVYGHVVED